MRLLVGALATLRVARRNLDRRVKMLNGMLQI